MHFVVKRILSVLAVLASLVASPANANPSEPLRIFAAASLKNALDAIAADFTKATGTRIVISYGATSTLARQIENGAPADVFVSADEDWMNYAEQRNLLKAGSRRNVIGNTLVLIGPANMPAGIAIRPGMDWAALLGSGGRLAVADPRSVPAGRYARAVLEKLGAWTTLEPRLARAENVRIALQFVAQGEAPLGIVYGSDQYAEPRTRIVATFDADLHPPIMYPAAVVAASRHPKADGLVGALEDADAQAVFRAMGFQRLPSTGKGS
jgi:molybdate transport system substrate-binding protein